MIRITSLVLALLMTTPLFAELKPDRPGFGDNPETVSVGDYQLEGGYSFTEDALQTHSIPELLFKTGVGENTELRFVWQGYSRDSAAEGVADMAFGFKQRILTNDFLLSLIAELSLPVGSSELSSNDYLPQLRLPWSQSLSSDYTLAGTLNLVIVAGQSENYFEPAASIGVTKKFSDQTQAFFEYFGTYPAESVPEDTAHSLNTGLTYLLQKNLQLDFFVAMGLNSAADNLFLGTGIAYVW